MKNFFIGLMLLSSLSLMANDSLPRTEIICNSANGNAVSVRNFSLGAQNDRDIPFGKLRAFIIEGYSTYLLDNCTVTDNNTLCSSSQDSRFSIKLTSTQNGFQAIASSPSYGLVTYRECISY